jgi:Carboxypeptidase regulatory-like domain
MKRRSAVLRCWFLLALAGRVASAQAPAPITVTGTVFDPSGAVIQHATVHLHGTQTETNSRTNGVGRFTVRVLPGRYDLSVEAPGFRVYTRPGLLVAAEHNEPLTISLAVAGVAEQMEVSSESGLSTEADANKSALVFKGDQMDTVALSSTTATAH